MVIYALAAWAPILMLGQATVLLTQFSRAMVVDLDEAQRLITDSLIVSAVIAIVALVFVWASLLLLPWTYWLNIRDTAALVQARPTAIIALSLAVIAAPLGLAGYALIASGRGVFNHVTMIAAQVAGLVAFIVGFAAHWPLWLLGATIISPLIWGGMVLWFVALQRGYIPSPSVKAVTSSGLNSVLSFGITILLFDLANIFLQRTPELVVARLGGLSQVAAFSAVSRLSSFVVIIIQVILVAIWPVVSEAAGRKDWARARSGIFGSLAVVILISAVSAAAIWLEGAFVLDKWTGVPGLAGSALLLAAMIQVLSQSIQNWVFTVLSSFALYRTQLVATIGAAVVYAALAPTLGGLWGPLGVVLAQSAGLVLVILPAAAIIIARHLLDRSHDE